MPFDALFAPLEIKSLTLRNRFALAAMSRYSSPGRPRTTLSCWRTSAAHLRRMGGTRDRSPRAGSHIGAQLWHHGALHPDAHYRPAPIESPSGLMQPGKKVGEPMTEAEGEAVTAAFAKGAAAAKQLGFDIVAVGRALLVDPQWVQKVRDGSYARIEPFDKNKAERVY